MITLPTTRTDGAEGERERKNTTGEAPSVGVVMKAGTWMRAGFAPSAGGEEGWARVMRQQYAVDEDVVVSEPLGVGSALTPAGV